MKRQLWIALACIALVASVAGVYQATADAGSAETADAPADSTPGPDESSPDSTPPTKAGLPDVPDEKPHTAPMACQRQCNTVICPGGGCFTSFDLCYDVPTAMTCCQNNGQTFSCDPGETVHLNYCKCGGQPGTTCPEAMYPTCE